MIRINTRRMSVLLLACMAIGAGNASALTLEEGTAALGSVNECSLRLDGVIEKGDNGKIAAHIKAATSRFEFYPDTSVDKQYIVCLSGPGGNYLEGIELAKTLSSLDVTTKVEDGQSCLSACAIAFLGGRFNTQSGEGYFPSRYLFPGSRLGFHAPQLTVPDAGYTKEEVQKAYGLALDAITELNAASKDLFISPDLIAAIVRHRDEDFYFIDTIDDLAHFKIDLAGYRKNTVRDDTRKAACWNAFGSAVPCSADRADGNRHPVHRSIAAELIQRHIIGDIVAAAARMLVGNRQPDTLPVMPPAMGKADHTGHDIGGALDCYTQLSHARRDGRPA